VKRLGFSSCALSFIGVAMAAGCAFSPQSSLPYTALPYMRSDLALDALRATGAGKIKHIVYIVQENRSFNNIFMSYPGAFTRTYGYDSSGQKITLQPYPEGNAYVIDHADSDMFAACNGTGKLPGTDCRMNGFNKESAYGGPPHPEYVYMPRDQSKPYWDMAHEGALADMMFQSQLDESFVAHQYIIAAQADWSVNLPYFVWGCGGGPDNKVETILPDRKLGPKIHPCYNYQTLGDSLDKAGLTWRFYAATYGSASSDAGAEWSGYMAVKHIWYGPDRKNIIAPNWKFITDVRAGKLANFTWITPVCDDSDHVNCNGSYGPSWVSALVNTVGESKFWDSTAIFVQWDDWGGLYDPVPPAYLNRDSLGFRVPLIVISPYAKRNVVSHVHYETASVLRFAEDLYGLPQLAAADKRANSPADGCFDFSQSPRPFMKIAAPYPPKWFMHNRGSDNYFAPDYE
jgi:phospholipase C